MAYVNVADWKPENVAEWLKGLDSVILPYITRFVNNDLDGIQLLALCRDDISKRGIKKVGHQEILLEAIEYLRNFHYDLDRENIQLLALRLSCQAQSLYKTLEKEDKERRSAGNVISGVNTQTLADVAGVISCIKPLVLWLDREPFYKLLQYIELRNKLLTHGLNIAICAQRDRFAENPTKEISECCQELTKLADQVVQEYTDTLILQPESLELVTIKKRAVGDDVGFLLRSSISGALSIDEVKLSGAAFQSGKIEVGDEVVQVNYQTVVGWSIKAVWELMQETSTQIYLTLKKRPKHSKIYGQIYFKPYRLPFRKKGPVIIKWDNLPSPRPEFLTIPNFELPLPRARTVPTPAYIKPVSSSSSSEVESSEDEDDDSAFLPESHASSSPASVRLLLHRTRSVLQRRATVSGSSPTTKNPPAAVEQFWAEIQKELQKKGLPAFKPREETPELRGRSTSAISLQVRPNTVLGSEGSDPRSPLSPTGGRYNFPKSPHSKVPPKPAPRNFPPSQKPVPLPRVQAPPVKIMSPPTHQAPSVPDVPPFRPPPYPPNNEEPMSPPPQSLMYRPPSYHQSNDEVATHNVMHRPPSYHQQNDEPMSPPPQNSTYRPPSYQVATTSTIRELAPITEPRSTIRHYDIYGKTQQNIPSIIVDNKITNETIHERAVDVGPIPPPRPIPKSRSEGSKSSALGLVARTVSKTKQRLSPRSDRKKTNVVKTKGRNISCKQLIEPECDGWLLLRTRVAAGANWNKVWFVLKDSVLYGFANSEAKKADKLINLPGCTAAAAPEVKSRQFAFKVYYTGTVFYFAAENNDELARWLAVLGKATLGMKSDSNPPYFSETEDEEPVKGPSRSTSSTNVSTSDHEPKAEEKRFGSLRRLAGSWKTDDGSSGSDIKYFTKILRQDNSVPVPTAQFRSYRRVDKNRETIPEHTKTLPSRLGNQNQRVMSVESVSNSVSTTSLPSPLNPSLGRDSIGSSPHLPTIHDTAQQKSSEKSTGKIMRLFSPGLSRKFGSKNSSTQNSETSNLLSPPSQPTLLGSPKLHRAFFRGRKASPQITKSGTLPSNQRPPPPPTLLEDTTTTTPLVNKSEIPDYPNLEYPPVFEPGTYTLNPEQFRNVSRHHTSRPKVTMTGWQTPALPPSSLTDSSTERRITLRNNDASEDQELVLISSLDLLASTDV